jgi:hypothetical protein
MMARRFALFSSNVTSAVGSPDVDEAEAAHRSRGLRRFSLHPALDDAPRLHARSVGALQVTGTE